MSVTIHLLKVRGVAKIPDYVEMRDQNFCLVGYYRVDRPDKALDKYLLRNKIEGQKDRIVAEIASMPYGKLHKLELS